MNISSILNDVLGSETYHYTVEKPITVVSDQIRENLSNSILNHQQNLIGNFIDETSFEATPLYGPFIKNFERKNTYLKGKLQAIEKGKTKISISIRANSIYGIFFFVFVLFSFIAISQILKYPLESTSGLFIFIIMALMDRQLAKKAKRKTKESFEEIINLGSAKVIP